MECRITDHSNVLWVITSSYPILFTIDSGINSTPPILALGLGVMQGPWGAQAQKLQEQKMFESW